MKKTHSKIILVYALLVLSYFFSYFFRVSTSVVLPMIRNEWSLSAGIVGFISSMYYYTYALMQPMCGVLNDRIGPEKVVGFGIVITSIGSLCFGLGNTTMWLIVGRLLMGVGLSPMLSGLLVFQGTHFAPERYAFFSGLSMMIGNMGAVFSVGPLSLALHTWGRSSIFSLLSVVTLGM
ncbi:MAG: MFS transporter, partial [Sphaerochaetaceae bacterium]